MGEVHYVSREEYDQILANLDRARLLRKKLKNPGLSLAEKIDLQRQAKALEAAASQVGAKA